MTGLEQQLLGGLSSQNATQELKRVAWDEVGRSVWVPNWEAFLAKHGSVLKGWTPAMLPTLDWKWLDCEVARAIGSEGDPAEAADFAIDAALAVALVRRSFEVETPPGGAVVLRKGHDTIEPFNLRKRLHSGRAAVEQWRELCRRIGIEDVDLESKPDAGGSVAVARA